MACSSSNITVSSHTNFVTNSATDLSVNKIDSLIAPFRDSVEMQMNEVVAIAENDFFVQRKPSGNLNNWVADAVFVNQTKTVRLSEPIFCLLNTGGIRASINKGNVTLGDLFKVMPFDNMIVWVKMPIEALDEIRKYIVQKGGDPLSNAFVNESTLEVNGLSKQHTHVWVITSDYLLNGGDNMTFFEKRVDQMYTNKLLRDALIEEARTQQVLVNDSTNRMQF
jgi:2',3'-cyclic-nucleotide 2'-phosphodiesterase (5'-nucleotidase family)